MAINIDLSEDAQENFDCLDERVKEEIIKIAKQGIGASSQEISSCESPIEQLLMLWMNELANRLHFGDDGCYVINPQYEIHTSGGDFRVDFLISAIRYGQDIDLVVECDGHDFHEKTKTQAAKDKRRDRLLKMAGHEVIHFTGSEIWKDPRACAREILEHLSSQAHKRNEIKYGKKE